MSMAVTNRKGIEIVYEGGRFPVLKAYMLTGKKNKPCVGTSADLTAKSVESFVQSWSQRAAAYGVPLVIGPEVEERFLKSAAVSDTVS